MNYHTWAEETQARELAEMQRNNALARVRELEDEAAKLVEILRSKVVVPKQPS